MGSPISRTYNEAIKSGFCYVTLSDLGTLSIVASSSNVSGIILTDGGSRIQITTVNNTNIDEGSINVTLNDSISSSNFSDDFLVYTPVIDARTPTTFKVGTNCVENHFTTVTIPTNAAVTSESFNPVVSLTVTPASITPVTQVTPSTTSVMLNPSGTGDVVQSIAVTNLASPVVESVAANTVTKSFVNNVAITNTTYDFMLSTNKGSGLALRNIGINISFRYR